MKRNFVPAGRMSPMASTQGNFFVRRGSMVIGPFESYDMAKMVAECTFDADDVYVIVDVSDQDDLLAAA